RDWSSDVCSSDLGLVRSQLVERVGPREGAHRQRTVPHTIACQPDGGLEPPEFVDQATFPSVRAGPDTALGDLVDLLPGPSPRPCDLGDEVLVEIGRASCRERGKRMWRERDIE